MNGHPERNLVFNADHWTDNVSHGELLRAGINQKLEINDINRADFLIQGAVNGNYSDYAHIPWDLGFIHNYSAGSSSSASSQTSSSSSTSSSAQTVPGKIEAENYTAMSGVQTEACSEGTLDVGYIDTGDWMDYNVNVQQAGTYTVELRVADIYSSGKIDILTGGSTLASVAVPNTGGWQTWTTITASINLSAGTQVIRIYASGSPWNLNWMNFTLNSSSSTSSTSSSSSSSSSSRISLSSSSSSSSISSSSSTGSYVNETAPFSYDGAGEYPLADEQYPILHQLLEPGCSGY